jgi:hypothetical protein
MNKIGGRGRRSLRSQPRPGAWTVLAVVVVGVTCQPAAAGPPTPEEYVSHVGGGAQIIPAGQLVLDGSTLICGRRPTVLDNQLDDYAAAYPGYLILNPKLLAKLTSTAVKLWIYSHECGHQFRGPDEETADCFAVQRGRRQKWPLCRIPFWDGTEGSSRASSMARSIEAQADPGSRGQLRN